MWLLHIIVKDYINTNLSSECQNCYIHVVNSQDSSSLRLSISQSSLRLSISQKSNNSNTVNWLSWIGLNAQWPMVFHLCLQVTTVSAGSAVICYLDCSRIKKLGQVRLHDNKIIIASVWLSELVRLFQCIAIAKSSKHEHTRLMSDGRQE